MINISILGSTGSIGTQALDVVREHSNILCPVGFSAGSNIGLLKKQIIAFSPRTVSVQKESDVLTLKKTIGKVKTEIFYGEEGNLAVATASESDRVVIATPGFWGIRPTLAALSKNKTVALATKEVLVAAGEIVMKEVQKRGLQILPIDSEHSAIFQCLEERSIDQVSRIFLTCSGGPFRGKKIKDLQKVTRDQALLHPSWKMGRKITIDSATLMNKGFEVIEAHWLFGIPLEKIKVIVHPQSVIHSAVEFVDGTIIAQLGPADMRLPIQYALFYPGKRKSNSFKRFSFGDFSNISFEQPDKKTFRCLQLAYDSLAEGGTMPAVLNAANDIAVDAFLNEKISFLQIVKILEKTLEKHKKITNPKIEEIFEADRWAREYANGLIN